MYHHPQSPAEGICASCPVTLTFMNPEILIPEVAALPPRDLGSHGVLSRVCFQSL
jgi:hypothetical protein